MARIGPMDVTATMAKLIQIALNDPQTHMHASHQITAKGRGGQFRWTP